MGRGRGIGISLPVSVVACTMSGMCVLTDFLVTTSVPEPEASTTTKTVTLPAETVTQRVTVRVGPNAAPGLRSSSGGVVLVLVVMAFVGGLLPVV